MKRIAIGCIGQTLRMANPLKSRYEEWNYIIPSQNNKVDVCSNSKTTLDLTTISSTTSTPTSINIDNSKQNSSAMIGIHSEHGDQNFGMRNELIYKGK